jgi:hypothetical protein
MRRIVFVPIIKNRILMKPLTPETDLRQRAFPTADCPASRAIQEAETIRGRSESSNNDPRLFHSYRIAVVELLSSNLLWQELHFIYQSEAAEAAGDLAPRLARDFRSRSNTRSNATVLH